jgi:hypothetical protein
MSPLTPLHTLNGSVVKRHTPVGKKMGSRIYVHREYAHLLLSDGIFKPIFEIAEQDGFAFNCVAFDTKDLSCLRLDSAPGFDTEREPMVGDYIWVSPNGVFRRDHSKSIWHHKWMWVLDDYEGFDVQGAYEWSGLWLSKVRGPAKGTLRTWKAQLAESSLLETEHVK